MPASVIGGAAVTGLGFLRGRPARDAVGSGVSLMVAAVPEGLPTLATIAQIASARRLAARGALVRNPRALEALGRVDQICFDKTGTLTQNSISLVSIFVGEVEEPVESLSDAARAVLAAAARATPAANGEDVLPDAIDARRSAPRRRRESGINTSSTDGGGSTRSRRSPGTAPRRAQAPTVRPNGSCRSKGLPKRCCPVRQLYIRRARAARRRGPHARHRVDRLGRRGLLLFSQSPRRGCRPAPRLRSIPSRRSSS